MGADFVAACVFCGTLLLRQDLPPIARTAGDVSAVYSTLGRDAVLIDHADVTAKSIAAGFRWARLPEAGLGAGTPASELRIAGAFPSVHSEGSPKPGATFRATGDGRMENMVIAGRAELFGKRNSLEAAVQQRRLVTAEITTTVEEPGVAKERLLGAERYDLTLGYRRRFEGFELAGRAALVDVVGKQQTLASRVALDGDLWGGALEARAARGPFVFELFAEAAAGTLSGAHFSAASNGSLVAHARIASGGGSVTLLTRWWDFRLDVSRETWRMPFVAFAVRGSETVAQDAGLLPDADVRAWAIQFVARRRLGKAVAARFIWRTVIGSETVRFRDPLAGAVSSSHVALGGGDILPGAFSLGFGLEMGANP